MTLVSHWFFLQRDGSLEQWMPDFNLYKNHLGLLFGHVDSTLSLEIKTSRFCFYCCCCSCGCFVCGGKGSHGTVCLISTQVDSDTASRGTTHQY